MAPDTPDDEPIQGVQDDGLASVPSREIGRRTKGQIGALILAAGVIWFFFDCILLPPGSILVLGLINPLNPPQLLYDVLPRAEFIVSAGTVGHGYLMWRSMREINTTGARIFVYSLTTIFAIVVIIAYSF